MITREQALTVKSGDEIHYGQCHVHIGERGGIHIVQTKARVSGKVRTWKKFPDRFEFPIKHGLYSHGHINEDNAHEFHLGSECALVKDPWLKMMVTPIIGNANDDSGLMHDLREYIMDSRNEVKFRAGAVRRLSYVVGVHPPQVPDDMLVRQEVNSFANECFDDADGVAEAFPNFDITELGQ